MFNTYIIQSIKTQKYYVESCADILSRLKQHNQGKTRSTKNGIPWDLVYKEEYQTKQEAYRREKQIKSYKGGRAFKKLLQNNQGGIA